jgi:hypothetical protein
VEGWVLRRGEVVLGTLCASHARWTWAGGMDFLQTGFSSTSARKVERRINKEHTVTHVATVFSVTVTGEACGAGENVILRCLCVLNIGVTVNKLRGKRDNAATISHYLYTD